MSGTDGTWDETEFTRRADITRRTLQELERAAGASPTKEFTAAVQELSNTLEELEVATEELRAANDELRGRQLELDRERARYQDLFQSAPVAYLTTTRDGTVTAANAASLGLLRVTERRVVGRPLVLLVTDDDRHGFRSLVNQLAAGQPIGGLDIRFGLPDEDTIVCSVTADPSLDAGGAVSEIRWMLHDVSGARRAQAALQAAFAGEQEHVEYLSDLDRWKDAFLAAAAHDLRSPLSVIRGIADTLAHRGTSLDDELQAELLVRLISQADVLNHLLTDLLDLDRFTRGVASLRRTSVDVSELVRQTVADVDVGDHPLTSTIEDGLVGQYDQVWVQQAIRNLVTNAAAHTPPETPIWVSATGTDSGLRLVVEDAGPGVPAEIADRLFAPFVRHSTFEGARRGSGLGLSLVQFYAEAHGGEVRVAERDGGGARFELDLPCA